MDFRASALWGRPKKKKGVPNYGVEAKENWSPDGVLERVVEQPPERGVLSKEKGQRGLQEKNRHRGGPRKSEEVNHGVP